MGFFFCKHHPSDVQIFHKPNNHLKIQGFSRAMWSKSHTKDPEILGAFVHNPVARQAWRLDFVLSWTTLFHCIVCDKKSPKESISPNKLKRYLTTKHASLDVKDARIRLAKILLSALIF